MEGLTQKLISNIEEMCQKYKINNTQINHIINKNTYTDSFQTINPDEINEIRKNYKVIDVNWLDSVQVNSAIFEDKYFESDKKNKQ